MMYKKGKSGHGLGPCTMPSCKTMSQAVQVQIHWHPKAVFACGASSSCSSGLPSEQRETISPARAALPPADCVGLSASFWQGMAKAVLLWA